MKNLPFAIRLTLLSAGLFNPFEEHKAQSQEVNHKLDSLTRVIETAAHDTTAIIAHNQRAELLMATDTVLFFNDLEKVKALCHQLIKIEKDQKLSRIFHRELGLALYTEGYYFFERFDKKKGMSLCHEAVPHLTLADHKVMLCYVKNMLADGYNDIGSVNIALVHFWEAAILAIETKDKVMEGGIYNNIALIYKQQGRISEAVELAMRGLKLAEEAGHEQFQCYILMNIGDLQGLLGQHEQALVSQQASLALSEKMDDIYSIGGNLANIGSSYGDMKQLEKALEYFHMALEKIKTLGPTPFQSIILNSVASCYLETGEFEQAEEYFQMGLALAMETNEKNNESLNHSGLGSLYIKVGEYERALFHSLKAMEIAREIGSVRDQKGAAHSLYQVFKWKGQHKSALEMYEKHIALRDSIQNEDNEKEIISQQFQYEYEKKAAADSVAFAMEAKVSDAEIARQASEIKAKNNRQYALGGGLALVLVFSGFLYNRFRVTNRQKKLIEIQKTEVERQHALAEAQRALVEEKNATIMESITYAKRIQTAILPPPRVVKEFLKDSFILYMPKDIVAGDFYWMEQERDRVMFAAADCTGHGVPGAMVSVICNNGLNRAVREYALTDPGLILDKTREIVMQEFEKSDEEVKDGMDISLCVLEGHNLHWAGANNPLWIVRDGALLETKADKQPIGKYAANRPFTTHRILLQPGDIIYSLTDGYQDQFGGPNPEEGGVKFKPKALKELLLSTASLEMSAQRDALYNRFDQWRGPLEQVDDVCVIGVRV